MLETFTINSLALPADGVGRNLDPFIAPSRVQLRKLLIWIGTDGAAPGAPFPGVDVFTSVYGPAGLIAFLAFDHYCNWVGVHQWADTFEPGQVVLEVGQAIGVGHCAAPLDPSRLSHSHTLVFGWYEGIP